MSVPAHPATTRFLGERGAPTAPKRSVVNDPDEVEHFEGLRAACVARGYFTDDASAETIDLTSVWRLTDDQYLSCACEVTLQGMRAKIKRFAVCRETPVSLTEDKVDTPTEAFTRLISVRELRKLPFLQSICAKNGRRRKPKGFAGSFADFSALGLSNDCWMRLSNTPDVESIIAEISNMRVKEELPADDDIGEGEIHPLSDDQNNRYLVVVSNVELLPIANPENRVFSNLRCKVQCCDPQTQCKHTDQGGNVVRMLHGLHDLAVEVPANTEKPRTFPTMVFASHTSDPDIIWSVSKQREQRPRFPCVPRVTKCVTREATTPKPPKNHPDASCRTVRIGARTATVSFVVDCFNVCDRTSPGKFAALLTKFCKNLREHNPHFSATATIVGVLAACLDRMGGSSDHLADCVLPSEIVECLVALVEMLHRLMLPLDVSQRPTVESFAITCMSLFELLKPCISHFQLHDITGTVDELLGQLDAYSRKTRFERLVRTTETRCIDEVHEEWVSAFQGQLETMNKKAEESLASKIPAALRDAAKCILHALNGFSQIASNFPPAATVANMVIWAMNVASTRHDVAKQCISFAERLMQLMDFLRDEKLVCDTIMENNHYWKLFERLGRDVQIALDIIDEFKTSNPVVKIVNAPAIQANLREAKDAVNETMQRLHQVFTLGELARIHFCVRDTRNPTTDEAEYRAMVAYSEPLRAWETSFDKAICLLPPRKRDLLRRLGRFSSARLQSMCRPREGVNPGAYCVNGKVFGEFRKLIYCRAWLECYRRGPSCKQEMLNAIGEEARKRANAEHG